MQKACFTHSSLTTHNMYKKITAYIVLSGYINSVCLQNIWLDVAHKLQMNHFTLLCWHTCISILESSTNILKQFSEVDPFSQQMPWRKQWKGFIWVSERKWKILLSLLKICHKESHCNLMPWKRLLISTLVKEMLVLHPLAQPAAWDWEEKLWVSCLPLSVNFKRHSSGDLLQFQSQRAFGSLRTFRLPFLEGNWLAFCSRNYPQICSPTTLKLLIFHLSRENTPDKVTELSDMVRKAENKKKTQKNQIN